MKTTKSSKTSRRVFVKTTDGEKLELTKSRLTQLPEESENSFDRDMACFVTFTTIRKATVGSDGLRVSFIVKRLPEYQNVDVRFNPAIGALGCCIFDEKTFNKIMRAAGSHIRFGQPIAPPIAA